MKPELLAPASSWPSLVAAVESGADSVYFGIKELNMRITAKNFELKELKKITGYCHSRKVKAYLCINTIVYEHELALVKKILAKAKNAEIDAIICWDMAVLEEAKKLGLSIHLSTQASVSNSRAAEFYKKQGASRIILARECSLSQIKEIKKKAGIEIETFIHGAMCVSISGRCFLSQEIFQKSANRGDCLQPCRRQYFVIEDAEEGHKLRLGKDFVLSPKDLCSLPFIDKLIDAGIDAFKIEGRGRSPEYVKTVVAVYRQAIDDYYNKALTKERKIELMAKLKEVYNRGFSSGFYAGLPTAKDFAESGGSEAKTVKEYIGIVKNFYKKVGVAEIKIESGSLSVGDKLMIEGNKTGVKEQFISSMQASNKDVKRVEKGKRAGIKLGFTARENDRVYIIKSITRKKDKNG